MLFNETLIRRRKDKSMTQDELADKLGVSRQSISKWENGECMPDAEKLIRLSDLLEISLDELTGRTAYIPAPREPQGEGVLTPADNEPITEEPPVREDLPGRGWLRTALIAAAILAFGVLCFIAGRYLFPDRSATEPEGEAAVSSPEVTLRPTEAPKSTPAPEKKVDDEWFIDEAWRSVQEITNLYKPDYMSREVCRIKRDKDTVKVDFGSQNTDYSYISVLFTKDENAPKGWKEARCFAYIVPEPAYEPDLQKILEDREAFGSCFSYEVTMDDLVQAGYEVTLTDDDLISAARYVLDSLSTRLTELEEDNLMRCENAKPVGLELRLIDPSEGDYYYDAIIAAQPIEHRCFTLGFSDACAGWLYLGDEYPECRYFLEVGAELSAKRNDDTSITVYAEIPFDDRQH